jgi:hypothetical protein
MDGGTNKPREIDLIVEKHGIYRGNIRGEGYGAVVMRLFIECKYIAQTNVFWFSDKDLDAARKWLTTNTPLKKDNYFTDQHHYVSSDKQVAKLFASKNKPNVENEPMYKALNQSLNAMVYLRRRPTIIRELEESRTPRRALVEMPVIVCDSFNEFYQVQMDGVAKPIPLEDNFQLEVNYAYSNSEGNQRTEYFLIDVVDFSKLDSFMKVLEQDMEAVFSVLGQ